MHSSVMKHSCFTVYKLCGYCLILSFCVGICCLFIACNESTHWNLLSFFFSTHSSFIYLFIIFFGRATLCLWGKKLLCRLIYWIFDEVSELGFFFHHSRKKMYTQRNCFSSEIILCNLLYDTYIHIHNINR